jgi:hypothetical protein
MLTDLIKIIMEKKITKKQPLISEKEMFELQKDSEKRKVVKPKDNNLGRPSKTSSKKTVFLVTNRIKTFDGTILISRHNHDYVDYTDKKNGQYYAVDGGLAYQRVVHGGPFEDLSVYSNESIDLIRNVLEWGSYGKDGKEPLHYKTLRCMDNSHIKAIIETQLHIPLHIKKIFQKELLYRKKNDIEIETE